MPHITVGPVIGRVTSTSIRVLVEVTQRGTSPQKNPAALQCHVIYEGRRGSSTDIPRHGRHLHHRDVDDDGDVDDEIRECGEDADDEHTPRSSVSSCPLQIGRVMQRLDIGVHYNSDSGTEEEEEEEDGESRRGLHMDEPFALTIENLSPHSRYRITFPQMQNAAQRTATVCTLQSGRAANSSTSSSHTTDASQHGNASALTRIVAVSGNRESHRSNTDMWSELWQLIQRGQRHKSGGMNRRRRQAPAEEQEEEDYYDSQDYDVEEAEDEQTTFRTVDLVLHLGGQVNTDEAFAEAKRMLRQHAYQESARSPEEEEAAMDHLEREITEMFRDLYRKEWNYEPLRKVLSSVSNLMFLGENDLRSRWGENLEDTDPLTHEFYIGTIARRVYTEYQKQLYDDDDSVEEFQDRFFTHDGSHHIVGDGGVGVGVLNIDQIIGKSFCQDASRGKNPYLSDTQWKDMRRLLGTKGPFRDTNVLLVTTSSPVVFMQQKRSEVLKTIERHGDVRQNWAYSFFREEQLALLKLLERWKRLKNTKKEIVNRHIVLLCGSHGCGGAVDVLRNGKLLFQQVIVGPITNTPASWSNNALIRKMSNMETIISVGELETYSACFRDFCRSRNLCIVEVMHGIVNEMALPLKGPAEEDSEEEEEDATFRDVLMESMASVTAQIIKAKKIKQTTEVLLGGEDDDISDTSSTPRKNRRTVSDIGVSVPVISPRKIEESKRFMSFSGSQRRHAHAHKTLLDKNKSNVIGNRAITFDQLNQHHHMEEEMRKAERRRTARFSMIAPAIRELSHESGNENENERDEDQSIISISKQRLKSARIRSETVKKNSSPSKSSLAKTFDVDDEEQDDYEEESKIQEVKKKFRDVVHERHIDFVLFASMACTVFFLLAVMALFGTFAPNTIQLTHESLSQTPRIVGATCLIFPLVIALLSLSLMVRSCVREYNQRKQRQKDRFWRKKRGVGKRQRKLRKQQTCNDVGYCVFLSGCCVVTVFELLVIVVLEAAYVATVLALPQYMPSLLT